MSFGSYGNDDHDDAVRIIRYALDAGITIVDTADAYSQGESDVIVASKFHAQFGDGANTRGSSRRCHRQSCRRGLGTAVARGPDYASAGVSAARAGGVAAASTRAASRTAATFDLPCREPASFAAM